MVLGGTVQPGDKIVVSVVADDLHFDAETGGAAELIQEEQCEEEPAAAPA